MECTGCLGSIDLHEEFVCVCGGGGGGGGSISWALLLTQATERDRKFSYSAFLHFLSL